MKPLCRASPTWFCGPRLIRRFEAMRALSVLPPFMMLSSALFAQVSAPPIALWPAGVPTLGAAAAKFEPGPEHDTTVAKDNLVAGKSVIRLGNVTEPALT